MIGGDRLFTRPPPPSAPIPVVPLKSGMGHDDQFPPPRLGARYRFNQRTFVATRGNERDAPIPDLPVLAAEGVSTPKRRPCLGLLAAAAGIAIPAPGVD